MAKLLITNGRVIDPANKLDQVLDILVENGKIKKMGKALPREKGCQVINAKNLVVAPGFVDLHVHLREPGQEDKETIATGTLAALRGGVTSLVCMPNTEPAISTPEVVKYVRNKAQREAAVNVFIAGAITRERKGEKLADLAALKKAGVVAVSDDGADVADESLYQDAMLKCKALGLPIIAHTEDAALSAGGQVHDGVVAGSLGLKGIPAISEFKAVKRALALVAKTKAPLHFTHLSAKESMVLIRQAKKRGLKISADVTPHNFSLTDEAVRGFNTYAKMNPPLRSEEHRKALLQGLKDGTIEVIATDHAPHRWVEKNTVFDEAPFGVVGLETMLGLVVTNLVNTKVLTLSQSLAKITCNPARVLGIKKGTLSVGADADITIFDPKAKWKVDITKFASKGMNSPWQGVELTGKVVKVVVGGEVR